MIAAVAPQKRGVLPPEHARAISVARAQADRSTEAYKTAVADALKAGASVREISAYSGLSIATVHKWGHARGWPTAEQRQAREDAAEGRREFRELMRPEDEQ